MNQRASILIVALWVLGVLTLFAVYIAQTLNESILVLSRVEENDDLRAVAEAGVKQALAVLKGHAVPASFSRLPAEVVNNEGLFKETAVGKGNVSIVTLLPDGSQCLYGMSDEESRINLNTASKAVLVRLFSDYGAFTSSAAERLADAVIDYRDNDSVHGSMSEEGFYKQDETAVWMKNAPFELLEEIGLIDEALDNAFFEAVRPVVTVYGMGTVNINTCSVAVLELLGLDTAVAQKLVEFRAGPDGIAQTQDDRIVSDIAAFPATFATTSALSPEEQKQVETLIVSGSVQGYSSCVHIVAQATLRNKKRSARIECVYSPTGSFLSWRQRGSVSPKAGS